MKLNWIESVSRKYFRYDGYLVFHSLSTSEHTLIDFTIHDFLLTDLPRLSWNVIYLIVICIFSLTEWNKIELNWKCPS